MLLETFLNLRVVTEPELTSMLAFKTPNLWNFFLLQPLASRHLLQSSDAPNQKKSRISVKKALSHVKYFNDQSIIEILFEEIMKKKKKCLNFKSSSEFYTDGLKVWHNSNHYRKKVETLKFKNQDQKNRALTFKNTRIIIHLRNLLDKHLQKRS